MVPKMERERTTIPRTTPSVTLVPTGTSRAALAVEYLGADSLHRWLAGQGWPVTRLAARSGYRLLQVDYQAERAGVSSS